MGSRLKIFGKLISWVVVGMWASARATAINVQIRQFVSHSHMEDEK
jgi:hypothetical protein